MALSNWDTIAWDEKGRPIDGVLRYEGKKVAEIYKNWVYVWQEGMTYPSEVTDGYVRFQSPITLQVYVGRGRNQSACYVAVQLHVWNEKTKRYRFRALYGIGCSGYSRHKYVGVLPSTIEDFKKWLAEASVLWETPPNLKAGQRFNQGDRCLFRNGIRKSVRTSAPGKALKPVFAQMLDGMK